MNKVSNIIASKASNCTYDESLTWDSLCGCYSLGVVEVCAPSYNDEIETEDDSGGSWSDCQYTAGGCEEDTSGDSSGGGGGPTSPLTCPVGQVKDANGECIDGEVPCVANPVKNPRIAVQENSGINGGRKGYTRSQGNQFHSGLDVKNDLGKPWFSPFDGNIDAVAEGEHDDLGYYVTVRFQKNGVYHTMQFGHLQKDSWPPNGSAISAGDVIGIQGLSDNLKDAIRNGDTNDVHSHIIVRKRAGSGWDTKNDYGEPLNPEQFIETKFDANGSPIAETDC